MHSRSPTHFASTASTTPTHLCQRCLVHLLRVTHRLIALGDTRCLVPACKSDTEPWQMHGNSSHVKPDIVHHANSLLSEVPQLLGSGRETYASRAAPATSPTANRTVQHGRSRPMWMQSLKDACCPDPTQMATNSKLHAVPQHGKRSAGLSAPHRVGLLCCRRMTCQPFLRLARLTCRAEPLLSFFFSSRRLRH